MTQKYWNPACAPVRADEQGKDSKKNKMVKKRSKVMKKKVTLSTSQKIASLGSSGTSATKTTEAKICLQLLKVQTCLGYLVTF